MLSVIPIAVIGGISHIRRGQITNAAYNWTMAWLSFGIAISPVCSYRISLDTYIVLTHDWVWSTSRNPTTMVYRAVTILFWAAPAIGGFEVVGQVVNAFWTCINIF
jgi:hypothetical protein